MKNNKYKWNNIEIIKKYFKCLKDIINCKDESKKLELTLDKQNIEDMLFFTILNVPSFPAVSNLKRDIFFDKKFISDETTEFQQKNIKEFIEASLNNKFKIASSTQIAHDFDVINDCLCFLDTISNELKEELIKTIENNNLFLNNNKHEKNYAGVTYYLNNTNYYEICLNTMFNAIITLNHELAHGLVNNIAKRKYNKENKVILYREVSSLLIEFYANNYLFNNNLIPYDEYVSNFNASFLINVYNYIEIIDVLYNISTDNNFNVNKKDVQKYIKNKKKKNINYNFDTKELTELPLKNHLIYLYSFMISLGIYYNYKDNQKEGLKVAFDIMKRINEKNEEEILKSYNINPLDSLNKYIDENNELIKKMNN